jgi:hypothetical protein
MNVANRRKVYNPWLWDLDLVKQNKENNPWPSGINLV